MKLLLIEAADGHPSAERHRRQPLTRARQADIRIGELLRNCGTCRIEIESGFGFDCDLSLARRCARQLNLRVANSAVRDGCARVSIDGIKIR